MAAAHARLRTVGVTGTNGKTTTTSMVAAIVAAAGEPAARVTTLGAWVEDERVTGPDLVDEFLLTVERAVARDVKTIAVEMTSKALAAGVARKWQPDVGVFTNVTRDHLDHHGTPEAYLAAKAQIVLALAPGGTAVLNGDDPAVALLAELVPRGRRACSGSRSAIRGAALVAEARRRVADGHSHRARRGELADRARRHDRARGRRRRSRAERAGRRPRGARARLLGATRSGEASRRSRASPVASRSSPRATGGRGLRTHARRPRRHAGDGACAASARRVVCVFGCGGNRDRGKRPQMGAIADAAADVVVLTTDNPRHEDPRAIATEIWPASRQPARTVDRRARSGTRDRASRSRSRSPDDVVVIAGKGHEQVQEIAGAVLPFSDAEVARAAHARC